jgi:hypothetical protein
VKIETKTYKKEKRYKSSNAQDKPRLYSKNWERDRVSPPLVNPKGKASS